MAFFGRNKTETEAVELVLPKHVGIIMDGNGRWAKKRGLPRKAGHTEGARTFRKITRYCSEIGIRSMSYSAKNKAFYQPIFGFRYTVCDYRTDLKRTVFECSLFNK